LQERHIRSRRHFELTGGCLVRDLLSAEQRDGRRIIRLDDEIAIWCPFAARTAWHIRFLPLCGGSFSLASDELLRVLSGAVRRLAGVLESLIGAGYPFNLTVVQPRLDEQCAFPWFVDLMPRLTRQAGWELLSDIDVIPFSPEQSALQLRALLSDAG
jgi:UDPglucose--hexose-1-phosphate uridylyltransferase